MMDAILCLPVDRTKEYAGGDEECARHDAHDVHNLKTAASRRV